MTITVLYGKLDCLVPYKISKACVSDDHLSTWVVIFIYRNNVVKSYVTSEPIVVSVFVQVLVCISAEDN